MTFRQLEYFCALIQEGTISKAAKQLYISQPALSQQIIALEKEFDIKILNRGTDPISITDDGYLIYEIAEKILFLKNDLENRLKSNHNSKLYIKTIQFYAHTFIPHLLSQLKKEFDDTEFKIFDSPSSKLFNRGHLENINLYVHSFDTRIGPEDSICDSENFIHVELGKEKILIATHSENPLFKKIGYHKTGEFIPFIRLKDIKDESFVVTTTSNYLKFVGRTLCLENGGFEPKFIQGEPTFDKLIGFIQFNNCVAFMPDTILKYHKADAAIQFYNMEGVDAQRQIVVSYLKNKKLSSVERRFIELAKELLYC